MRNSEAGYWKYSDEAIRRLRFIRQAPALGRGRWQATVASLPAIGTALLPKLTCPLCLPAYAALLSALGLEFFDYTPYLLPLTLAFLAVALGALALHAKRTGHWIALMTGVAAAAIVLLGKFTFELCSGRGPDEGTLRAAGIGTPA